MNILVVEDNPSIQKSLDDLLSALGFNVDTASNGLDALAKVQNRDYQLFIIDHLMPLMNGVQLTKNLNTSGGLQNKKVIFMTTQGVNKVMSLPECVLFDKVIDKPIDIQVFKNLVAELTELESTCEAL